MAERVAAALRYRKPAHFHPSSMLHEGKGPVRSIPKLGRGALDFDCFQKGLLDLTKSPSVPVLLVSEGSPESEYSRAPKWTEKNGHGIELPLTAEVIKRRSSQGESLFLSLGPVQDHRAFPKTRKHVLSEIRSPERAFGRNEQHVSTSCAPQDLDRKVEAR